MRLSLRVDGAEALAKALTAKGERLAKPPAPLLQAAAALMATYFQDHIRSESGPDGSWPGLHPSTRAIRKHYGHEAGKLVRAGDLLHSLTTLAQTANSVDVGTRMVYARVLQDGGQVTDEHGTRTVQAFPFVYFSDQEIADVVDTVTAYYFGEGA